MAQRTLTSYSSSTQAASTSPSPTASSLAPSTPDLTAQWNPDQTDEFRHLVWQVYQETYQDAGRHPHPVFTKLRTDHSRWVAMQIYAGLMNGHSLTDAVATADIDFSRFEDRKKTSHPQIHRFDALARSYLWGKLRGIRFRSRIIGELEDKPNVRRELGYGTWNGDRRCPHQTNFNAAWNERFGPNLKAFINEVIEHVRNWAYDNNRLIETTNLILPDDRDETEELSKEEIRRIVNEMVGYITPSYSFNRSDDVEIEENVFFKLLAHCALTGSSVYGGGDTFEWSAIDDDDPPHGRTFLDLIREIPKEEMLMMFQDAVSSIFEALNEQVGIFEDTTAPVTIDTTTIESDAKWKRVTFKSISDPEHKDIGDRTREDTYEYIEEHGVECLVGEDREKIRHADFEDDEKRKAAESLGNVIRYVHGTDSGGDFLWAWEFAGAAIAHSECPLVFAMEPLERKDQLEDHVQRFIERAQELVTISDVYMDSAYAQIDVFNQFHYGNQFRTDDTLNTPYVMNMREYETVTKAALEENPGRGDITTKMAENDGDITVVKNFVQRSQGKRGETTLVGLPKRDYENGGVVDVEDPAEDRVVFCTNRTDIDAGNATNLLRGQAGDEHDRGYTNRWLVEIGFQKIKDFLAFTKSSHSGIRLFYTLYATLLFDVWMTVDRTIKKREYELAEDIEEIGDDDDSPEYASEPRLSADVLSVIVANYLRPIT